MTSAAHVHAVTAEVEQLREMYPGCRVTTELLAAGTSVKVWREPIGCVDARIVRFEGDE